MRRVLIMAGIAALACVGTAFAQLPVLVDEDFQSDPPLSYLYQDPGVSADSFAYNAGTEDMGGIARRGINAPAGSANGTAERAYVGFDATGYGDADEYLSYTECFNFCFDFNISAAGAGPDERLMLGLWYNPADAEAESATYWTRWANRQHAVAVTISHDLADLKFSMFFGNGGNWAGRSESIDVTGAASLSTDTDYRVCAHYRYDGSTYGQLFGEVWRNTGEAWVLTWVLPQQVITQDTDIYDVAYINFTADTANRRFLKLSTMGAGNETWGSSNAVGPTFTSDNWKLNGCIVPEPGVLALFGFGVLALLGVRRKK